MKIDIPNVFKHGRKSPEKMIPVDERPPKAQGCQVATQRTITLTLTLPQFNLVGKALSLHSPIAYELNLELLRLLYAQEQAYINGLDIVTKTLKEEVK